MLPSVMESMIAKWKSISSVSNLEVEPSALADSVDIARDLLVAHEPLCVVVERIACLFFNMDVDSSPGTTLIISAMSTSVKAFDLSFLGGLSCHKLKALLHSNASIL